MRAGVTIDLPGETEAGSAWTQPSRGIAWRAHRDDAGERGSLLSRSYRIDIGSVDPNALKIPARRAVYSLTGNARIPFQAEPAHEELRAEAAREGMSLSRYVAALLDRKQSGWPVEYFTSHCGFLTEDFAVPADPLPELIEWR